MDSISYLSDNELFNQLFNIMLNRHKSRSIKKNYDISSVTNAEICSQCGGKCCKKCGCHFSPDDFQEISFDFLKQEIEKGYISIDYVDREIILEDFGMFILRIRNQKSPIVDVENYTRNPCILLTEKGCKLDYEHRPTGGKLLIPDNNLKNFESPQCHSYYDIDDCCHEWKPYQEILYQLVKYFKNKDIPCSL